MEILKGIHFQKEVFWKNKIVAGLEAIAVVGMLAAILLVGIGGANSQWVLSVVVRFSFYLLAFMAILSYIVFIQGSNREMAETSAAITGGRFRQRWCALLAQMIVQGTVLIVLFLTILLLSKINDGNDYFRGRIFLNYSWNILLPWLIVLLVSWTCSYFFSVRRGSIVLIGFLLMASPLIQEMVWRIKPAVPIDRVVQIIRWPFAIMYQNSDWSANNQLDFQLEQPREQLIVFWILLLMGINIIKSYFHAAAAVVRRGITAAVLVISAGILAVSYLPASTYHLNDQWNGSLNADYNYYKGVAYQYEMLKNPDYRAEEMDLSVKLGRQMKVDGRLKLTSESPKAEFVFTLYHGYHVKHVSDPSYPSVEWRQEGDLLYIRYPEAVTSGEIQIEYEGYSPTYYSFSGGAMLPAYFAWYPMAGEKQIYVFYEDGGYGYNSYIQMEPTRVRLCVDTDMGIVTNLAKMDDMVYEGVTTGISLFTGLIEPTGDEKILSYLPATYWQIDGTLETENQQMKQSMQEIIDFLKNDVGITDIEEKLDKPVILVSRDISRNGGENSFNIMGDHIIVSNGGLERGNVIKAMTKKYGKVFSMASQFSFSQGENLKQICETQMNHLKENIEACQRITKNPDNYEEEVVERCRNNMPSYVEDLENIQSGVEKYGEEEFLKKVLQYALSDEPQKTDENFMLWLEENEK